MSYHLRLCKALSYRGVVSATKKQPDVFVEDKATADEAVATGYFKLIEFEEIEESGDDPAPEPPDMLGETPDYEELSKQTKAELIAFAKAHGISTDGCKTKGDILQEISHAYGGSYTIMELQEK